MDTLDDNQQNQIKTALYLINFIDFETDKQEFQKHIETIYGEGKCPCNSDENIIMRIINYLYSGEWDLENLELGTVPHSATLKAFGLATLKARINKFLKTENIKNKTEDEKKHNLEKLFSLDINKEFSAIIDKIRKNWSKVFVEHNKHILGIRNLGNVSKILVYEAPPYPDDDSSSINYLLLEGAIGSYVTAIKNYSQDVSISQTIPEILTANEVLFFDLLMLPIPLSSDVRKSWFEKKCFLINDKPLPVHLFEMNLNYLKEKKEIKFVESPVFAIGTPHLTALPIFRCFSGSSDELYKSLSVTNNIETRRLDDLGHLVLPLFKACFVNASNNPDANLLKLAFGNFEK